METNITYQKSYREYKAELDGVLQRTAESFVQIGYLLKVARDTNVLAESGYKSVTEFAEAEYNLNKTQVSRFISINDKFSEGGYSDHLLPGYVGFGYAKLTLMLQLPDAVNEGLTPWYSKTEIQAIKEEVEEEKKVSDIETYLEAQDKSEKEPESVVEKAVFYLGESEPELFVELAKACAQESSKDLIKEILVPQGEKTYSIRIPGTGRVMLMLSDQTDGRMVNVRTGETVTITWEEIKEHWVNLTQGSSEPKKRWSELYCRPFPVEEKTRIAPVQQKSEKTPTKKESKTVKAPKKTEWKSSYKVGQQIKVITDDNIGELKKKREKPGVWKVQFATYVADMREAQFTEYVEAPEQETEEQVPGQTSIEEDFKEFLPEPSEETVNFAEIAEGTPIDNQPASGNEETEKLKREIRNTILLMNTLAKQEDWKRLIEETMAVQRCAEQMLELENLATEEQQEE